MTKTANKRFQKFLFLLVLVQLLVALPVVTKVIANNVTELEHEIQENIISVDIVDDTGATVASPGVTFGSVQYSFEAQDTTGTLGNATQKIRVTNATTGATWVLNIAATDGAGSLWSDGGTNTHPFDSATPDDGSLTVDPSGGTLTALDGCLDTGITKGTSDSFVSGTNNSIDLLNAGASAETLCRWDFTGVSLTQRIPALQEPGLYNINMTLSIQ